MGEENSIGLIPQVPGHVCDPLRQGCCPSVGDRPWVSRRGHYISSVCQQVSPSLQQVKEVAPQGVECSCENISLLIFLFPFCRAPLAAGTEHEHGSALGKREGHFSALKKIQLTA